MTKIFKVATGRTLLGTRGAKGQQLEDHYFGYMDRRVYAFIQDAERKLWKLGIPVVCLFFFIFFLYLILFLISLFFYFYFLLLFLKIFFYIYFIA